METQAPEAVAKRRLARRDGKSCEISDARLEDFESVESLTMNGRSNLPARELMAVEHGEGS